MRFPSDGLTLCGDGLVHPGRYDASCVTTTTTSGNCRSTTSRRVWASYSRRISELSLSWRTVLINVRAFREAFGASAPTPSPLSLTDIDRLASQPRHYPQPPQDRGCDYECAGHARFCVTWTRPLPRGLPPGLVCRIVPGPTHVRPVPDGISLAYARIVPWLPI